jgi:hypothetical protein
VIDELALDLQIDDAPFGIAVEPHGSVGVARIFGTIASGGTFESYRVDVAIVERDRISRLEVFELDDLPAALARFAALRRRLRRSGARERDDDGRSVAPDQTIAIETPADRDAGRPTGRSTGAPPSNVATTWIGRRQRRRRRLAPP